MTAEDIVDELIRYVRERDAEFTKRLRRDAFESNALRGQAVGRLRAYDELRKHMNEFMQKNQVADDVSIYEDPESPVVRRQNTQPRPRPWGGR